MVDEFKSDQSFEQRKSQNLTFWDYAKSKMLWQYLPIMAGLIGFGVGRLRKGEGVFPIDGSPMIVVQLKEKLFSKGYSKVTGKEAEKIKEWFEPYTRFIHGDDHLKRERLEKDAWNVLKGLEFSSVPLLYHLWRSKEAKKLDLEEASNRLQVISDIKPSDDELRLENTSLKQQLDFVERQTGNAPTKQIDSASHAGKMQDAPEQAASPMVH